MSVSVIMPSFLGEYEGCATDRENKFVRAVNSFLKNSIVKKELIIVGDNCKTTRTLVYKHFIDEWDKGLIVFHEFSKKQKLFSGKLRSKGIELSSNEYICYLDTDDILGEHHLTSIYKQVKNQNLDWAYFNDYLNTY